MSSSPTTSDDQAHVVVDDHVDVQRRLYCISDIHTDHADNQKWLERLCDDGHECHANDALIVAGDIGHQLERIESTLRALVRVYGTVVYVPGNHEAWLTPADRARGITTSLRKLTAVCAAARALGAHVEPVQWNQWCIAPLLSWYGSDFDPVADPDCWRSPPRGWSDFHLCDWSVDASLEEATPGLHRGSTEQCGASTITASTNSTSGCTNTSTSSSTSDTRTISTSATSTSASTNASSTGAPSTGHNSSSSDHARGAPKHHPESPQHPQHRVMALNAAASIQRARDAGRSCVTVSHFLPLPSLMPPGRSLRFAALPQVAGSRALGDLVQSIAPAIHVFGHTHIAVDQCVNGTRYVQACLGYPRERSSSRAPRQPCLLWDSHATHDSAPPPPNASRYVLRRLRERHHDAPEEGVRGQETAEPGPAWLCWPRIVACARAWMGAGCGPVRGPVWHALAQQWGRVTDQDVGILCWLQHVWETKHLPLAHLASLRGITSSERDGIVRWWNEMQRNE